MDLGSRTSASTGPKRGVVAGRTPHTDPDGRAHGGPAPGGPAVGALRLGCVSFLNAKPLIDGLENGPDPLVRFDVPSGLLADLEAGTVDLALCPVIDYQRSRTPLVVVPVGGIGCDGPTLTVRLFSRVPLDRIACVHADTDSHTSVALLRVLLDEVYGVRPRVLDRAFAPAVGVEGLGSEVAAVLLIGDKVVTGAPPAEAFPHQLDLGEAWKHHTGLPFVFAVWMARQGTALGSLPRVLDRQRRANQTRIGQIVKRHASAHGWPEDQATRYLGHWLRYEIGPRQVQAMERFFTSAHRLGLTPQVRSLEFSDG